MAVPARKVSKTRGRTRRAHMALTAKATTKCPKCGAVIKSHRACKECGYYKNTDVLNSTKEENVSKAEVKKETKKETKAKETKKTEKKEVKKETKKAKSKKEEK